MLNNKKTDYNNYQPNNQNVGYKPKTQTDGTAALQSAVPQTKPQTAKTQGNKGAYTPPSNIISPISAGVNNGAQYINNKQLPSVTDLAGELAKNSPDALPDPNKILKYSAGTGTLTDAEKALSDLNGDGVINVADARAAANKKKNAETDRINGYRNYRDAAAQGLYDAGAFSPSDLTEDSMLKYADAVEMLRNYGIYTPSENVKNAQADADKARGDFMNADPYEESKSVGESRDLYALAREAYENMNNARPGEYQSKYEQDIAAALDLIMNRDKFSYDYASDPAYQAYAKSYTENANKSLQNALAASSALTGGYGNSYASGAAQSAYAQQMNALSDVIPELYQAAYERYMNETNDLYNRYNILADADNTGYSRYRDTVSDWNTDRNFAYQGMRDAYSDYSDERNFDYGKYSDDWNRSQSKATTAQGIADSMNANDLDRYSAGLDYLGTSANASQGLADDSFNKDLSEYDAQRQYYEDAANMAAGIYDSDYGNMYQKNRDIVSDSQWQTSFDEGVRQFDTGLNEEQRQFDTNTSENRWEVSAALAAEFLQSGIVPTADMLEALGISQADAERIANAYKALNITSGGSGGSGGGSGGYSKSSGTVESDSDNSQTDRVAEAAAEITKYFTNSKNPGAGAAWNSRTVSDYIAEHYPEFTLKEQETLIKMPSVSAMNENHYT